MSLKVWLPLNGDLHNQGCSNITVNNTGATVDANGKIGSCYNFVSKQLSFQTPFAKTIDNFSVTAWVNLNTGYTANYGFHIINFNLSYGRICISKDNAAVRVLLSNGSNIAVSSTATASTLTAGVWNHFAITFSNGTVKIYINGILDKEQAISISSFTYTSDTLYVGSYSSEGANGKLNDLRLYDHCLSAAEVHEISQGLVLHYKLDSLNNNLISNSTFDTAPWTTAIKAHEIYEGRLAYRVQNNTLYTNTSNGTTTLFPDITFESDTQYTLSVTWRDDYRTDNKNSSLYLRFIYSDGSTATQIISPANSLHEWKHQSITSNSGKTVSKITTTYGNGGQLYITDLKLEKGTIDSGFTFNNDNIIQDSSGYGHNGTINGTLTLSLDTPRYSNCTVFNGSNARINVPNLTPSELTVSFWMKRGANTGTRQFMYTAWNGITCELQTNGTPTFAVNRSSYPTITGTAITTDSGWVHYCATFDTTNGSKLYQNGVLKSSNSNVTPIVYNISTNYIGYYNTYYNGKMSDFRIYCTALSAADVKQLYEMGAKVDNKGNLHCYEAKENNINKMFITDSQRGMLEFGNGLTRYTQANCQVTLTKDGYHIYRPPNTMNSSNGGANNMWGGLKLTNSKTDSVHVYNASIDNLWGLQEGHTYLWAFHIKGQSSNSANPGFSHNMGNGVSNGVAPSPTIIKTEGMPTNFQGEKDCFVIFTINDTITKTSTTTSAGFQTDSIYLSYRHFTFGFGYTNTGELGTDLYLTNFRLYDVTSQLAQILKVGIANFHNFVEENGIFKIRYKSEAETNNLIEL